MVSSGVNIDHRVSNVFLCAWAGPGHLTLQHQQSLQNRVESTQEKGYHREHTHNHRRQKKALWDPFHNKGWAALLFLGRGCSVGCYFAFTEEIPRFLEQVEWCHGFASMAFCGPVLGRASYGWRRRFCGLVAFWLAQRPRARHLSAIVAGQKAKGRQSCASCWEFQQQSRHQLSTSGMLEYL